MGTPFKAAGAKPCLLPPPEPLKQLELGLRDHNAGLPLQMVMRVTALRGTVPQQWVADFQAAMEGFGAVALTQRAQLADVYAELAGNRRAGRGPSGAGCARVPSHGLWLGSAGQACSCRQQGQQGALSFRMSCRFTGRCTHYTPLTVLGPR